MIFYDKKKKAKTFPFLQKEKRWINFSIFFMELMRGFEPLTCALRVRCSTNWATSAQYAFCIQLVFESFNSFVLGRPKGLPAVVMNHSLSSLKTCHWQLFLAFIANWATSAQFFLNDILYNTTNDKILQLKRKNLFFCFTFLLLNAIIFICLKI